MSEAINILVSDEGNFVEIENDEGKSINIGKWSTNNDDSISYLRITIDDIKKQYINDDPKHKVFFDTEEK